MDAIRAWAILDSGATSHFLMTAAPMTDMRPTSKPIIARLPNMASAYTPHTRALLISLLPSPLWCDTPISSPAWLPTP